VYRSLWAQYQDLLRDYRALTEDHQGVLEDHEGLLYDLERSGRRPAQTSWGRENEDRLDTEEIPQVEGLDPDKADALVRNVGLLREPSGSWGVARSENG
jgi:hypothetical protein